MNEFNFVQIAHAATDEAKPVSASTAAHTEVKAETAKAGPEHAPEGLSIQPTTIAFQALNFVILAVLLNMILYKPLTKLLTDREQKIKKGVEDADKAELALKEADQRRQEMLKRANAESQAMLEKARKTGEELKTGIVDEAHQEAGKILKSGQHLLEMEKAKTVQELKMKSVHLIVKATEKLLREKIDAQKDTKMIEESLNSFAS